MGKRGPSPGKHTEMVWSPVAGRWRRIFQKRRVENAWEIPFTQWERIIERTLERDEEDIVQAGGVCKNNENNVKNTI